MGEGVRSEDRGVRTESRSSIEYAEKRMRAGRQQRLNWTITDEHRLARTCGAGALPERLMMRAEKPEGKVEVEVKVEGGAEEGKKAVLKYYVPFKGFFGGWLVYELGGKLWRQYATPSEMRAAGVGFTEPI